MIPAIVLALASTVYVPPAGPDATLNLNVGGTALLTAPRDAVARKAVAGMAKLGFRYAGVGSDGHPCGYSDAASVVVFILPVSDGRACAMVTAAAWTNAES